MGTELWPQMSWHLCGENRREEAERNKTTVMEYSLGKAGIRKPGWIETGGSGRSCRQELKKETLGDREMLSRRGRGTGGKEGESAPSNPFCQSQWGKENWDPGLSQTLDAAGLLISMNLQLPGYERGLAITCLILFTILNFIYLLLWGGACYGRNVKPVLSFHHGPGREPQSSGVVASPFIQCAISLAPVLFL